MRTSRFRYLLAERNSLAMLMAVSVVVVSVMAAQTESVSEVGRSVLVLDTGPKLVNADSQLPGYIRSTSRSIVLWMTNFTPANANLYYLSAIPYAATSLRAKFVRQSIKESQLLQDRNVLVIGSLIPESERLSDNVYSIIARVKVRDIKSGRDLVVQNRRYVLNWVMAESGEPRFSGFTYELVAKGEKI